MRSDLLPFIGGGGGSGGSYETEVTRGACLRSLCNRAFAMTTLSSAGSHIDCNWALRQVRCRPIAVK